MRRIILSIILGFVIPVAYGVVLTFGEDYVPESLMVTEFYGQPVPGILVAPITLPVYLIIYTKEKRILPFIFDTIWFRGSSLILFTWALYAVIFYFILGRFERFKKRAVASSATPPPPPEFER